MTPDEQYDVFKDRRADFGPSLFMAVETTGIFCRPGCPARLPNRENVTFFKSAEAALRAGFRPCKRCHPASAPGEASALIKTLINLVEDDPERRWSEKDLLARAIDPSTARRQFKARFGLTFSQYVRARNLARAQSELGEGGQVIAAQLAAGFDSPSGFRAAYAKVFGTAPKNAHKPPMHIDWIDTQLGPMVCVADETRIYLTEFTDRKNMERQVSRLSKKHGRAILPGHSPWIDAVKSQLTEYYAGTRHVFDLPLETTGTQFQKKVWRELQNIPFGETRAYADLAEALGDVKSVRAVAGSNASNGFAILIPCHRVIAKDGSLGGYAGGLARKQWLLDHEAKAAKSD